jgi:ATPase family associated with various cellular activities (AAA)/Winged helix domain, variant
MAPGLASAWATENQRYLSARLAMVCDALKCHAQRAQSEAARSEPGVEVECAVREAADGLSAPAALDTVCAAFRLSPFERDVLLLCAGMELDASFPTACASAHGHSQRAYPTFSLALAALSGPHWSALTPAAPLRHWRLIDIGPGDTLMTSPLRIDECLLHYLAGVPYLDERLRGVTTLQPVPQTLPPSHRQLAARIVDLWTQAGSDDVPLIHLAGEERASRRALAAAACAVLGMQLRVLRVSDMPTSVSERETVLRLWEREGVLTRSTLLVECDDTEGQRPDLAFLDHTRGCLLVASRTPLQLWQRRVARLEISRPGANEQQMLWQEALGPLAAQLDGRLQPLVSQFNLGAEDIRAAGAEVLTEAPDDPEQIARRLWNACRANGRPRLDDLAQRIEPIARWDDLVLPPSEQQSLRDIAAQVRHRTQVYQTWGFASKSTRGLGLSALFTGASGTGKTMAAEVLAGELRLDLYRIDLSQVVSKYIGETEKNLRRVFDAAESGGAVLLFDEADALFGKRSEVRDSHDRYANIEISYLLQRMESYRGLAILTTNMKNALDASFLRRLRFVVQFPFPDAAMRAEIWRRVIPAETPVDGLDTTRLARLNVAGGNIRSIAL